MEKRTFGSAFPNLLCCVTVLVVSLAFSSALHGQPPANDNCVDVTPRPCPIDTTGNNENATNDGLGVCVADWYGPETWHAFTLTSPSDVRILVCGLENYWADGWEYVILVTACNCDNVVPAHDWIEYPSDCTGSFGGYAVTWTSLPPGTYYYPVLNSFAVNGYTAHGAYTISITCSTCPPATQTTVLRSEDPGESVDIHWFADDTNGNYEVWRTANPSNDGSPDNGADPDWNLVGVFPAPATPGFQTCVNALGEGSYYNYVVVHVCTP